MDARATTDRVAALPLSLPWNVLALLLQHCDTSIMLDFLSFYSSRELRMRQWCSDMRLAATKKRKKKATIVSSERFEQYYRAGNPLFTRAALLDIATQISSGQPILYLDDFHGLSTPRQRERVPDWITSGYAHTK